MLKTYWPAVMAMSGSITLALTALMETERDADRTEKRENFIEMCIHCVCSSAEKQISNEIRALKLISSAEKRDRMIHREKKREMYERYDQISRL